jgi:fatty acid desaturase
MSPGTDPRVDRMYGGDRIAAIIALAALWATLAFVFWSVLPFTGSNEVLYVLAVGVGMVLLFNTASIFAMLSHYSEDRQNIYGLDLHYLDEMKKSKL